jgi:hypothetical protein
VAIVRSITQVNVELLDRGSLDLASGVMTPDHGFAKDLPRDGLPGIDESANPTAAEGEDC